MVGIKKNKVSFPVHERNFQFPCLPGTFMVKKKKNVRRKLSPGTHSVILWLNSLETYEDQQATQKPLGRENKMERSVWRRHDGHPGHPHKRTTPITLSYLRICLSVCCCGKLRYLYLFTVSITVALLLCVPECVRVCGASVCMWLTLSTQLRAVSSLLTCAGPRIELISPGLLSDALTGIHITGPQFWFCLFVCFSKYLLYI